MEENNSSNQPPQYGQPQNQNLNQPINNQFGQIPVPNSAAVLVLGILSIVFCICYGIIGLVLGIVAIVLAGKANALYKANPNSYTQASYNNVKAGKICAIIGTCLSSLYFIILIIYVAILGAALTAMPWDQMMRH